MLFLFSLLVQSQGGNSTSEEICGSSIGTIENSETLALVVGLVIMFVLVIYSRSVSAVSVIIYC